MARFGFCGGTYQSLSPNIDAELAMNLFPEAVESAVGRSAMALIPTDGLSLFASLPAGSGQSVPGGWTYNGRSFCCGIVLATQQMHLYEILANGTLTDRGALGAPATNAPALWAANPNQIVFTVAGTGAIYVFTLATNVVTVVNSYEDTGGNFAAAGVLYLDGFFVAFLQNSNVIQVSNLEDGSTWLAINVANVSEFPDNIVSMKATQRTLWLLGRKASVPYYNTGALFPFAPVPGTLVEEGSAATYGIEKIDNTIVWIGGNDDQGYGIAWRMNGYTPQRISTHAVETAWQSYARVDDAISYTYQTRGHKFWHIYFPTADASWRYDIATGLWHQVGTWNPATGKFTAHKSQWHTQNFRKHLVGDPFSGNIYALSINSVTDNGVAIRRVRRSPYIADEHENLFHGVFELLCETGLASQIVGPSESPVQVFLADPLGNVWGIEIDDMGVISGVPAPAGQIASSPIIADNDTQGTFWLLSASAVGLVVATPVPVGRTDTARVAMATKQSFLDSGLQVNGVGVVSAVNPLQHYREPLVEMRYSDDGGHTWTKYDPRGLGLTGNTQKRLRWMRLGKSRNRVYEVAFSDPVSLRIVDAYVKANPDWKPTERLSSQLSKSA